MEAVIISVEQKGLRAEVTVSFRIGEVEKSQKLYILEDGQTIDFIKPQIKEDLTIAESISKKVAELKKTAVQKIVDLKGVLSVSEQAAADAIKKASTQPVTPVA